MPVLDVACAIIEHNGMVLAVRRSEKMKQALLWEFPGGKLEPNEKAADCIVREIEEELSITVQIKRELRSQESNGIRLIPFICSWKKGSLFLQEHKEAKWLPAHELPHLAWCPADIPVVEAYLKSLTKIKMTKRKIGRAHV